MARYINSVETAKLIRRDLKATFKENYPTLKFSVNKEGRIKWVDGPTEKEVLKVVGKYKGASFDGMIDLESTVYSTDDNGDEVVYGIKYIFLDRQYSVEFLEMAIERSEEHAYLNGERVKPDYVITEPSKWSGASIKPSERYSSVANDDNHYWQWDTRVMKWAQENSETHDQDALDRAEREQWEKDWAVEEKFNSALKEAQDEIQRKDDEVVAKFEAVIEALETPKQNDAHNSETSEPEVSDYEAMLRFAGWI